MKSVTMSIHIWRAIEVQAKTVADSMNDICRLEKDGVEIVNEFELERLQILIQKLKEKARINGLLINFC